MSSVDPSQVPGLVTKTAYSVIEGLMGQRRFTWSDVAEVRELNGAALADDPNMMYGESFRDITGAIEPEEIAYGQDAPARTVREGYTRYVKFVKLAEAIDVPEELYSNPNANNLIVRRTTDAVTGYFAGFESKKQRMFSDMFNKGGLTAGHATFDGSFEGHVDPYPKFIYDNKPFFARTGNNHPLYASTTTLFNAGALSLNSSNLDAARRAIMTTNALSETGEFIGGMAPDLLLVPPALESTARVLVESQQLPGSAQNDVNINRSRFNVVVDEYLTDDTAWFLGSRGRGVRVYRNAPGMRVLPSAPERGTGNIKVRFVDYFGRCVTDWRPWYGNNVPTS